MAIRFPDQVLDSSTDISAYTLLSANKSTKSLAKIDGAALAKNADMLAIKAGGLDAGALTLDKFSQATIDYIGSGGNIVNQPDDEDLHKITKDGVDVLQFNDRSYVPGAYSGSGVVILRKNLVGGVNTLTAAMLGTVGSTFAQNVTFIVRYDFKLTGWIRVGNGCRFLFEGGSISSDNGSFILNQLNTGTSTYLFNLALSNKSILTNVFRMSYIAGTLIEGGKTFQQSTVGYINVADFGIVGDGVTDVTDKVENLIGRTGAIPPDSTVYFPRGIYRITRPILIQAHNVTILGDSNGFDADSNLPILASTHSAAYTPTNTIFRGSTVLYFDPDGTGTAYDNTLFMFMPGSNNFRTNYTNLNINSNRYRHYITEDYANGVATGPKHRGAHYEAPKIGAGTNLTASALHLLYGIAQNVNIYGFDGAGFYLGGETAKTFNCRVSHCGIGLKGLNPKTGAYVTDNLVSNCYVSRCNIGFWGTYWWFMYDIWADEIETYLFYDPTNLGLHLEITGIHINHIDYAAVYTTSLVDCQIIGTFNRCGCYYAGYNLADVPDGELSKACQIYATNINKGQLIIKNTEAKVGDIEATRGGYCITANIVTNNLLNCQINLTGFSVSGIPITKTNNAAVTSYDKSILHYYDKITRYLSNIALPEHNSGTSAERPTGLGLAHVGYEFFDTTLAHVIYWAGTKWVDALGTEILI